MLDHIPPPETRTLRERIDIAIKLSRELEEHLRGTLAPASRRVRRVAEGEDLAADRDSPGAIRLAAEEAPSSPEQRDRAVRNAVDGLLTADRFAAAKRDRLNAYCGSIRDAVGEELGREAD